MHKVLDNSEILNLILGFSSTYTCAGLITTSQNFFKQGAIHVWKNLSSPEPLLLLIPGTKRVIKQKQNNFIELPVPSANFSRFDFYARFVQTLNIFGPSKWWNKSNAFYIDHSWQTLVFRAQQSTLLPNLRELKLDNDFETAGDPILWLSAFLSPSIRTFEITRAKAYFNAASSLTSVALRLVTQTCPDVENITLYLGPPEKANSLNDDPSAQASALHIIMGAPMSRTWLSAQNLRSLVTDVHGLDESSLLALGQLPYLSSLEIRKIPQRYSNRGTPQRLPNSVQTMSLSENAFPSLRRIATYEVHGDDILLLWSLKPIIKDLIRLELIIPLAKHHSLTDDQTKFEGFLTSLLPVLCAESTQLTDLVINCNPAKSSEVGVLYLDADCFKQLASLSLQYVELVGINLSHPDSENKNMSSISRITALWPAVVELRIPDQNVQLFELHHFALLPNLRHLVLNCWETLLTTQPTPASSDNHPLHTLEFGKTLKHDFKYVPVSEFAKYLLTFWPNLRQVVNPPAEGDPGRLLSMEMLNQCIRVSQGITEVKRRIMREYGTQAAQRLLPVELADFLIC
ncbi:hypothetical protein BDV93DRAFT_522476 [Ceratobasidium sp. AG-I]|nr:hypothetical protein BDV93DRAFT_522476 [Ceratobasidium sp. AG-I]